MFLYTCFIYFLLILNYIYVPELQSACNSLKNILVFTVKSDLRFDKRYKMLRSSNDHERC